MAAEQVAAGQYVGKVATFEEAVRITGRASDYREPRLVVCGADGHGIAKNENTLF